MEPAGHATRDAEAPVIPDGLDVPLLGKSMLAQIDVVASNGETKALGVRCLFTGLLAQLPDRLPRRHRERWW